MPELSHTLAYRIVHGAFRNALDGHPQWRVPPALPQSVAKRAAGTLLAHAGALAGSARQQRAAGATATQGAGLGLKAGKGAGASYQAGPRQQLHILHCALGAEAAAARLAGDAGREAALIDALRLVGRARRDELAWPEKPHA